MRADRLVAILLLLQARGQVTAAEVAEELEVSERTARRDLDALGMAGVPIYAVRGRNGGWRLAGGGKTDLSGLTAPEVRALFLLTGPGTGATGEVKAALRKLVRALPEPLRAGAEAAASSIVVDVTGWGDCGQRLTPPPLLDDIQRAVVDRSELELDYAARNGAPTTRVVQPLGVVAKGERWYLLADTDHGRRSFRIDRISASRSTGEPATRPDDFDLEAEWREVADRVDELRTPLRVTASADRWALPMLRAAFGNRISGGGTDGSGSGCSIDDDSASRHRATVELRGHNVRSVAADLAGFGGLVTVIDPPEVRAALAAVGAELVAAYASADNI